MSILKPKLRVTQTLLSSWLYSFKSDEGYDSFINTLYRMPTEPTEAMLDGRAFEDVINAALDGEEIPSEHEWYAPCSEIAAELQGAQKQVTLFGDISVCGENIVLHGVLDFLKAGTIYDTKFSKNYKVGKYLDSPQHPMYLKLVPEAKDFRYLISDGVYVYKEKYTRDDITPIEYTIEKFLEYLHKYQLFEIFEDKWVIKQ